MGKRKKVRRTGRGAGGGVPAGSPPVVRRRGAGAPARPLSPRSPAAGPDRRFVLRFAVLLPVKA